MTHVLLSPKQSEVYHKLEKLLVRNVIVIPKIAARYFP